MAKKNVDKKVEKVVSIYRTAYAEIIKVLELEEEGVPIKIDDDATDAEIIAQMKDAITFIDGDVFTDETQEVIDELSKKPKGKPKIEEEDKEDDEEKDLIITKEDQLKEMLNEAETFKELKEIVLTNVEFKSLKGVLANYKTVVALRQAMLKLIPNEKGKTISVPATVDKETPAVTKKPTTVLGVFDTVYEAINTCCVKGATMEGIITESEKIADSCGGKKASIKSTCKYILQVLVAFNVLKKSKDTNTYKF